MTGGVFDLTNQEVFIKPTGFTENISGVKIRITLSFSAYPSSNMRIKKEFRVKSGYVSTDIYQIAVGP